MRGCGGGVCRAELWGSDPVDLVSEKGGTVDVEEMELKVGVGVLLTLPRTVLLAVGVFIDAIIIETGLRGIARYEVSGVAPGFKVLAPSPLSVGVECEVGVGVGVDAVLAGLLRSVP